MNNLKIVLIGLLVHLGSASFIFSEGAGPDFWTLEKTILQALQKSPALMEAKETVRRAQLEEPALLANTDPAWFGSLERSEDWSPTPVPQILGTRTIEDRYGFGVRQKWLTGSQAQVALRSTRIDTDASFRPVNPTSADQLEFSFRQPLLKNFWGRPDKALRRKARQNVKSAQSQWLKTAQDLSVKVSEAYLNLAFAIEDLRIKGQSEKDFEKLLAKQKEKKSYGVVEESDVLQAQAALKLKKLEVQIAQSQIRIARQSLFTLMGEPEKKEELVPVYGPETFKSLNDFSSMEKISVELRPDLEAAKTRVESIRAELNSAELDSLPSFDFVSRYGLASLGNSFSQASSNLSERGRPFFAVGVQLDIPFFRKKEKVNLDQVRSMLRAAEAHLALAKDLAGQELKETKELYQLAVEKRKALEEVFGLQKAKFEEEEKNFQRGRSSTDILIRFQGDLQESERLLLRARLDEILARVRLAAGAGVLMQNFGFTGYGDFP